ncbi:MAG: phosphotransferase [bacterium]
MKVDVTKRLDGKVPAKTIIALTTYIDELFFTYDSPVKAFVHTDIQGKNIIYDTNQHKIAGIIDFTDSRI